MTTMELHMNNLDSGIASDDSNGSLGKSGGITSEVKLSPNGAPNTNDRGDLKRKSLFDSTYIKPLGILAAFFLIGLLILAFKAMTPEEVVRTVDGGEASTIRVNNDLDGRSELNADQVKYLSDRDRAEAAKNAREGVSSVPIVDRAEVTTDFTTYDVTTASDSSAVTQSYQTIPKTVAQLDAENAAAQGNLYSRGVDNDNHVVFTNRQTGQLVVPIDKVLAEGFVDKNNATYNTNDNYNANNGGQNQGGNNQGGNNQGGNNQGGQAQGDSGQQQAERQPDPMIESKRAQLSADYENFQAQQAELDAKEQQLAQAQQQRYQQQQDFRSNAANRSLNDSLNQIKNSVGSRNSYTALSYNSAAAASQVAGTGTQTNVAYNPSAQNAALGSGYTQGIATNQQYGSQTPQNNYAGYQPNGALRSQPNQQPLYDDLEDKVVEYDENGNIIAAGKSSASAYNGTNNAYGASNGLNLGFSQGVQSGNSSTTYNSSQTGEVLDQRLPANIIRAGTKWQAIITKAVNTDEGLQVIGELVTGKFAGSTIYGTVQQSGKNIGVQFNAVAQRNSRKPIMPISSYATTIGEQKTALSKDKDINNHYVRNYGIKGLSSVLRGIGEAYDGAGETSIVTDSGTVITTKDSGVDADEIRADVLGELGKDLTADIAKLGNRVPTYKIPMGTVVNVVLSSDLDINGTTSTIAQGSQAR